MADGIDAERIVYRLGVRTPCCARIARHVDWCHVLCRGCGTVYVDVSALVCATFPGAVDVTAITPRRFLKGGS